VGRGERRGTLRYRDCVLTVDCVKADWIVGGKGWVGKGG